MAKVNISEAIQLSKVSRQTFYSKYLNPGKISVEFDDKGKKWIDTAELIRVFGSIDVDGLDKTVVVKSGQVQTARDSAQDAEIAVLREQLHAAQERERGYEDRERWYRQQLEEKERRLDKLTDAVKLLEHKVEAPAPAPRRGFFARLFGGVA